VDVGNPGRGDVARVVVGLPDRRVEQLALPLEGRAAVCGGVEPVSVY
jgi:hypothetical protein